MVMSMWRAQYNVAPAYMVFVSSYLAYHTLISFLDNVILVTFMGS